MNFNTSQEIQAAPVDAVGHAFAQLSEHATPLNAGYALIGTIAALQLYKSWKRVRPLVLSLLLASF